MFPQYGGAFCRVIDNQEPPADQLIDDFKTKDSDPVIAISVDVLDTGIDVSEVVNLVFAKAVKTPTKCLYPLRAPRLNYTTTLTMFCRASIHVPCRS
jgi:hypothetical protein